MAKILVVDDEKEVCTFFSFLLRKKGYEVRAIQSGREALVLVEREQFDLALLDLKLIDLDGLFLLKKIKEKTSCCQAIIMTGYGTVKSAIKAIQLGALDYIEKPFNDLNELEKMIESALNVKPFNEDEELFAVAAEAGLILGENKEMLQKVQLARRIASKNITVLLQGETGAGKEVFARFIHRCSSRADNTFISVNCAAIPEGLLESELFGFEQGAFTGASRTRKGLFEIASNGTLFLDEISEASLKTQAKLLQVLETGEYMRVGGETVRKTDSRIIAATNVFLDEAIRKKRFRKDLFYRLNAITLEIPSLKERREDIPVLLDFYLKRFSKGQDVKVQRFADAAVEILCSYNWPGNVRELVNLVHQLVTVTEEPQIMPRHLPEHILKNKYEPSGKDNSCTASPCDINERIEKDVAFWLMLMETKMEKGENVDLSKVMDHLSEAKKRIALNLVKKALSRTLGERKKAANLLGITPRKLKYIFRGK